MAALEEAANGAMTPPLQLHVDAAAPATATSGTKRKRDDDVTASVSPPVTAPVTAPSPAPAPATSTATNGVNTEAEAAKELAPANSDAPYLQQACRDILAALRL